MDAKNACKGKILALGDSGTSQILAERTSAEKPAEEAERTYAMKIEARRQRHLRLVAECEALEEAVAMLGKPTSSFALNWWSEKLTSLHKELDSNSTEFASMEQVVLL